jgi:chloramphenicol 3-O-phosphotransferase
MKRWSIPLALVGALVVADVAHACGACVEDKVAATYDHAVISQAMRRHQQVLFVGVDGPRAQLAGARLSQVTRRIRGVDTASVRTSASPAALSFAVDASQNPQATVDAVRAALRDPQMQLTLIRIARDGVLIEPR